MFIFFPVTSFYEWKEPAAEPVFLSTLVSVYFPSVASELPKKADMPPDSGPKMMVEDDFEVPVSSLTVYQA